MTTESVAVATLPSVEKARVAVSRYIIEKHLEVYRQTGSPLQYLWWVGVDPIASAIDLDVLCRADATLDSMIDASYRQFKGEQYLYVVPVYGIAARMQHIYHGTRSIRLAGSTPSFEVRGTRLPTPTITFVPRSAA